jgi:hypothetical protein
VSMAIHFRGFKKVYMITVLEGNGHDEAYREVQYFYDDEKDYYIAKHDPLTEIEDENK